MHFRCADEMEPRPELRAVGCKCEYNSPSVWPVINSNAERGSYYGWPVTAIPHGFHVVEAPAWTVMRALRLGVLSLAADYR